MKEVENGGKDRKTSTAETRCTTCMSFIPTGAKVCLHCDAYQKKWLNTLTTIAKISGALAIVGSLIVFTITKIPEVRKIVAWKDDIQILYFTSDNIITVLNTGDGDVLLQNVLITSASPKRAGSFNIPINQVVKAGDVLTYEHTEHAKTDNTSEGKKILGGYVVDWSQMTADERTKIDSITLNGTDPCYSLKVRLPSDEVYQQVQEHYQKQYHADVMTKPHSAKIFYYSINSNKTIIAPFKVVAMVFRSADQKCE